MLRGSALRVTQAALLATWLVACESGYPLAPTLCDDWCLATQRADCPGDWPHECAGWCTHFLYENAVRHGCEAQWRELLACYQAAPDGDFYCRGELSQARPGVCAIEQSRLGRCVNPVWQSCYEVCAAFVYSCDDYDVAPCSQWCAALPDSCLEAVPYHDCLIEHAAGCDFLAPECMDARAEAVRCPADLVPEPND